MVLKVDHSRFEYDFPYYAPNFDRKEGEQCEGLEFGSDRGHCFWDCRFIRESARSLGFGDQEVTGAVDRYKVSLLLGTFPASLPRSTYRGTMVSESPEFTGLPQVLAP